MALLPTKAPEAYIMTPESLATMGRMAETVEDDGPGARRTRVHSGSTMDILAEACKAQITRKRADWSGDTYWTGATFATAAHLAIAGWVEGAALVDDLFARITAKTTESILPQLAYVGEPGEGEVDIALAIEGEEECWLAPRPGKFAVPVGGRWLNIVFDPFASCSVAAEDVLKRGTYVAALAVMAERGGYRVRVSMRMPNKGSGYAWLLNVAVKEYEESLDVPRLMFWMAHPAMLRQIVLSFYANYRKDNVMTRSDGNVPEGIHVPGISYGTDLDGWLQATLQNHGLIVGEGA